MNRSVKVSDEYSADDVRVADVIGGNAKALDRVLSAVLAAKPGPRNKDAAVRRHKPRPERPKEQRP